MEYIIQELNIPRKQIKETNTKNRFKCIIHKQFLKVLIKSKKLINVSAYSANLDEWPQQKSLGSNWDQIYLVVNEIIDFSFLKIILFIKLFWFASLSDNYLKEVVKFENF
jgi:hypothetical protein